MSDTDRPDPETMTQAEQEAFVLASLRQHIHSSVRLGRMPTVADAKAGITRALEATSLGVRAAFVPRIDVEMEGTVIRWFYLAANEDEARLVEEWMNRCLVLRGAPPAFAVQREPGTERLKTLLLPAWQP